MAKLRGVKPAAIEKRLKMFLYGMPGVGKTTAAIQFPNCYLIDTERGAENDQYVAQLEKSGGAYFFTTDLDDLIAEVTALMTTKHSFKTLIIDPLTVPYADKCMKEAVRLGEGNKEDPSGTAFGRNKQVPDRLVKHLFNLCTRLDMNVIITSHAKPEWKSGSPTGMDTFDCYGKIEYIMDLSVQIQKRGQNRVGVVKKTRIESFPEGDTFDFSYAEIAKRYGKGLLEKEAVPEVLATAEQVKELARLCEVVNISKEVSEKWLDKAGAETFAEMPKDVIEKCIAHCQEKVKPYAADKF